MQAMTIRRLSDCHTKARRYLDGKRVSQMEWNKAHFWTDTDTYCSRVQTRKDGSVVVREYHYIRRRAASRA